MALPNYQLYALAIGLGGMQAMALSYPVDGAVSPLLQITSMMGLLRITQNKHAFRTTWLYATTWLCASVWWLFIALHQFGQLPAVLSVLAIFLLCGGLSLYYACAVKLYAWSRSALPPMLQALMFAAAWTAAEMARAQWFTGFPWAAVGYAHVDGLLSGLSSYTGVYGVGFAAAWVSAVTVAAWMSGDKHIRRIAILGFTVALPVSMPVPENVPGLSVALLQGNIAQNEKFTAARQQAIEWYKQGLQSSHTQLSVLPETAIPYFKSELPGKTWEDLTEKFQSGEQAAIIGIPTRDGVNGYGNSAIGLGMDGGTTQYDKHHLVPFGEFTPASMRWFTNMLKLGFADFNRGPQDAPAFAWKGNRLAVNICYEDLFGEELAKRFVSHPEGIPTVLVNISNIAWFGDTVVVRQHLNIARMRSLEFKTPSIRATNSGGTAIINAHGVITHQLPPYTQGILYGEVAAQPGVVTPFAYWAGHWGLKPLWLICLGIMLAVSAHSWRGRKIKGEVGDK